VEIGLAVSQSQIISLAAWLSMSRQLSHGNTSHEGEVEGHGEFRGGSGYGVESRHWERAKGCAKGVQQWASFLPG